MRTIRIYIEGGGNSRSSWRALRAGFRQFLGPHWHRGIEIIPGGSGGETFKDFKRGLKQHPHAINILLVDSETSVSLPRWEHLRQRNWAVPRLPEDRCHFMAQATEAWLVADPDALAEYYGRGFNRKVLPGRDDVEAIPKEDLLSALNRAASGSHKQRYAKHPHCADLLGRLDRDRVRRRARHCDLLFTTLAARIRE